MTDRSPPVLVIGGGVIGCAVAWRLARGGARVAVVDREPAGGPASFAAGGMLSPLGEADAPGPFLELGLRSLDRYPTFVREVESASGMEVGYRRDGRLDVALTAEEAEALRRRSEMQRSAGHESRMLDAAELRATEPAVSEAAVLGVLTPHDHQVDNERLTRALRIAAASAGVEVRSGAAVTDVLLDRSGSRVVGVRTADGERLDARTVVVAAGAWSGRLALPSPLPVRPVLGQIVVLSTSASVLGRVTRGADCYLIPRSDGRLLVGATVEDRGFTVQATAGGTARLLAAGMRVLPAVGELAVAGFQTGLRPDTPDHLPIIGRDVAVEGLIHATGHFRNGVLLAPETAELVAGLVLQDEAGPEAFSPARFAEQPGPRAR